MRIVELDWKMHHLLSVHLASCWVKVHSFTNGLNFGCTVCREAHLKHSSYKFCHSGTSKLHVSQNETQKNCRIVFAVAFITHVTDLARKCLFVRVLEAFFSPAACFVIGAAKCFRFYFRALNLWPITADVKCTFSKVMCFIRSKINRKPQVCLLIIHPCCMCKYVSMNEGSIPSLVIDITWFFFFF